MGANAQTAVPVFTAGQVLTAQQQTEINTGIPVFATTVTRDAAFGGAGEKTLAEGQFAYIEATNATQYYDGAAWQSVGASSGLTLIKTQTIGTTVSSVEVTGAFSATYDNYFITVNGGVASTNNSLVMTLGATTTGYYYVGSTIAYNASPTFVGEGGVNTSNWGNSIRGSANSLNGQIYVYDPFAAKNTHFSSIGSRSDTSGSVNSLGGYLANTTSYTAFTLTTNSGTVTGGTIRVYGLANS
jgi:hypothetical protein